MKIEVELPQQVEVSDYHELDDMRFYLKKLNKAIKVVECGHNGAMYQGMIYVGSRDDENNASLYRKIVQECKD